MKRTIENNGVYVECSADDALTRMDDLERAEVIVLTKGRIELSGADKAAFLTIFKAWDAYLTESSPSYCQQEFDDKQKADVVLRMMLLSSADKS